MAISTDLIIDLDIAQYLGSALSGGESVDYYIHDEVDSSLPISTGYGSTLEHSSVQEAYVASVFESIDPYIDLDFTRTSNILGNIQVYSLSSHTNWTDRVLGTTWFRGSGINVTIESGWKYTGSSQAAWENDMNTIIHEIGHALGLGHPDGDGFNPAYTSEDTVMSYNKGPNGWRDNWSQSDIDALVSIWGAENDNSTPTVSIVVATDSNDSLYGDDEDDDISGLEGNDIVKGGNGNDSLYGNNGSDWIYGQDGDDTIDGGDDDDTLYGNEGSDIIYGGYEDDYIDGGYRDDLLYGDDGDDTIYGGFGDDTIEGGVENDSLYGNQGSDKITGGTDEDKLYGGPGYDTLYGNEGADVLYGNKWHDVLYGGKDNDWQHGGQGADRIYGNMGVDEIYGGSEDDWLNGGQGNDKLWGNQGADKFCLSKGDDQVMDFNASEGDWISMQAGTSYNLVQKGSDLLIDAALGDLLLVNISKYDFDAGTSIVGW